MLCRRTRLALAAATVLLGALPAARLLAADPAGAAEDRIAVAVLTFSNEVRGPAGEPWDWLAKGLADLIINDLSQHGRLQLVSREQMQLAVLRMEHDRTMVPEWQDAMGKLLKVARVVSGTYRVEAGKVAIRAVVLDMLQNKPLGRVSVQGAADDVLKLEKRLVAKVLRTLTGEADAEDFVASLPVWTDSASACKLLYQGVDHFDYGRYEQAWLHFRRALRQDATYADAKYWAARMYYYQLRYGHALAELVPFVREHPRHPRAGDAIGESAHAVMLATGSPAEGVAYCQEMLSFAKDTPVFLAARGLGHLRMTSAAFLNLMLAELHLQSGDDAAAAEHFYRAWSDTSLPDPIRQDIRHYFNYAAAWLPRVPPAARAERFAIGPDRTEYEGVLRPQKNIGKGWDFYVHLPWFECDEAHYIDSVELSVSSKQEFEGCNLSFQGTGRQAHCNTSQQVGAGLWQAHLRHELPPMTRQVQLAIYGPEDGRFNLRFTLMPKERTSARLRLKASRAGVRLRAYHRQRSLPLGQTLALPPGPMDIRVCTWGEWVRTFGFHVMDKQVTLKPGELCELSLGLPPPRAESGWQSATPVAIDPAEPILLRGFDQGGTPGVGAAQDPGGGMCTYQPERYYPHLMLGKGGRLIACVAFFGDIWVSHSDDEGRTWSPMRRLPCPVNSAHAEASPSLILDDRGRYCLAFLSDRNILRRFWPYACFSDDLTHWSRPSKVSEVESQSVHLMQDSAGRYLLTQGTSRGVLVTSSDNCRTWGKPLVAWAYQRAKTNTGLTGGVARAALAQWPDGAYQLLMIHLQPTRTYLSKTAYSLRAIPRLRTGRSRDLSSWTDWHLLQLPRKTPKPRTDYREPAFPSFCMAPGVGLLLSRSAGGPRWFRSEAGRHWHVCTDAKPSAYDRGHGICVTPGGRLVSLHADTNWWERLPWFSAFVADSLPRWLEGRTWKPLPREDPTQEWRIVEFEESANDERQ